MPGDPVAVLVGPVEAERRTPVVQNEHHAVAEIEGVPQCEQVVTLLGVVVAVRSRVVEFVGVRPCRSGRRRPGGRAPSRCGITLRHR